MASLSVALRNWMVKKELVKFGILSGIAAGASLVAAGSSKTFAPWCMLESLGQDPPKNEWRYFIDKNVTFRLQQKRFSMEGVLC
jgi:hypothetical protein